MNKQLLFSKSLLVGTLISFSLISLVPLNYIYANHITANFFHVPFYLIGMAFAAVLFTSCAYFLEPKITSFDLSLLFIIATLSLSQITSVDRLTTSINIISFSVKGLCFAFIGMRMMKNGGNILFAFLLIVSSMVSLIGLTEYFSAWNPFFSIAPALLDSLNRRPGIVSTIGHSIPLAAYLILILPLSIEYVRRTRTLISYIPPILMSTTIFLSLSRSGWISALVAVAIYFSQKNWIDALKAHRNKAIAVLGLVLVIFVFIPGTRNTLVNRTINLAGLKADYSYSHRIASYRTTLNILKHYPLFGVGLGNYPAVHETYYAKGAHIQIKTPDNIYLRFLCETGIIGTVLFFTILMYWLYVLFVNRRDSFVAAIFAGLAGFMINQAVADLFFWTVTQFTFWLLLGIAVSRVYSNEQKISI